MATMTRIFLPVAILLFLSLSGGTVAASSVQNFCPDKFELVGLKCYHISTEFVEYDEAREACLAMGAKLAEPRTAEESILVTDWSGTKSRKAKWLGMNDIAKEGTMVYDSDGSPLTADNFDEGQPDDWRRIEDCVTTRWDWELSVNKWNDRKCNATLPYICETEQKKCSSKFEEDVIFAECSIRNVASVQDCFEMCRKDESCQFFTYGTVTRGCGLRTYRPSNFVTARTIRTGTRTAILNLPDTTFVGFARYSHSPKDCQRSCQEDDQCMSFTWNGPQSANPNICVHNYGRAQRRINAGPGSGIVSGAKLCSVVEHECQA